MKTISAKILKTSMLLSLFACSKQESPVAEIDFAYFKGQLGQISLNTSNSGTETFIKTTGFNNGSYSFKLEMTGEGYLGYTHEKLFVSLNNVMNQKSFNLLDPIMDEKNTSVNGIYFNTKRVDKDYTVSKLYSTIKGKRSIEIAIDSIAYKKLRTPSLIGIMKGYLFNVENSKDSIMVDASFSTQASR